MFGETTPGIAAEVNFLRAGYITYNMDCTPEPSLGTTHTAYDVVCYLSTLSNP